MAWWQLPRRRRSTGTDADIPPRGGRRVGAVHVNETNALQHSAVFGACRLRADLLSTLPLDVYRDLDGIEVEVPPGLILTEPAPGWDMVDWLWATQFDLDRAGNAIGLILEKTANNLPAQIEPQDITKCQVIQRKGESKLRYRINGTEYDQDKVWHERQYRLGGLPVGLSPTALAALSIGEYLSAQQFANDWFRGGGVPKARLRNKERKVPQRESAIIKDQWRTNVENGDLFVHGNDWEYDMMQAQQMGVEWLESRRFGLSDVARFYAVPSDLLDAAISAPGSVTYQTGLQRNLQFLVMNFGPAIKRREKNLSKLTARPRKVRLNADALLRMDPLARAQFMESRIRSRTMTPDEARAKENQKPLTPEQEQQFHRLFGDPNKKMQTSQARDVWAWEQVSPYSAAPYVDSEVR